MRAHLWVQQTHGPSSEQLLWIKWDDKSPITTCVRFSVSWCFRGLRFRKKSRDLYAHPLCFALPSHHIPCYSILCHPMPSYAIPSHAMPCHPNLSYPLPSHPIPCHPNLSYPMPSHPIPFILSSHSRKAPNFSKLWEIDRYSGIRSSRIPLHFRCPSERNVTFFHSVCHCFVQMLFTLWWLICEVMGSHFSYREAIASWPIGGLGIIGICKANT